MSTTWKASAAAIIVAQNAGRLFSYYDLELPIWQRRRKGT